MGADHGQERAAGIKCNDDVALMQGEDHEAADDEYGECGVLNPGWQKGVPGHDLVHCVGCSDQRCEGIEDPSRDGTVAVEDVRAQTIAEVVAWLRSHWRTQDHSLGRLAFLAAAEVIEREFGVSERTERIHDQATKEKDERRH